jgi:hypothetical protein
MKKKKFKFWNVALVGPFPSSLSQSVRERGNPNLSTSNLKKKNNKSKLDEKYKLCIPSKGILTVGNALSSSGTGDDKKQIL